MQTFAIEIEMAAGARSPFVAVNRKPVSLQPDGANAKGTITVDDGTGPDSRYLLTTSFVGDVGAKCRVKVINAAGTSITTNWIEINHNTVPFGASHRRFSL